MPVRESNLGITYNFFFLMLGTYSTSTWVLVFIAQPSLKVFCWAVLGILLIHNFYIQFERAWKGNAL